MGKSSKVKLKIKKIEKKALEIKDKVLDLKAAFKSKLVYKSAQRRDPKFKVLQPNQKRLSAPVVTAIKKLSPGVQVSFSPTSLTRTPKRKSRTEALSSTGVIFEKYWETSELTVFRERTPSKGNGFSPNRVSLREEVDFDEAIDCNKKLSFALNLEINKTETKFFSFAVTRDMLIERLGVPRPCTQNQLMGVSAKEIVEALGLILTQCQDGNTYHRSGYDFNWCHKWGWAEGGEQDPDNLDVMTRGANLATLFLVEIPLKEVLIDKMVDKVLVDLEVDYNAGLAFKATYTLKWGSIGFFKVFIDPRSHSKPTVRDNFFASATLRREVERTTAPTTALISPGF